MGVTYIEGVVVGPGGEAEVRFLVDGGVTYTLLPEKTWRKIGNRLSSQAASYLHISRRHRNRAERIRMLHQATAG